MYMCTVFRSMHAHASTPISVLVRSLVLAGHLLYASPLASLSRALRVRLRDMSGTDMVLRYVTDSDYSVSHSFSSCMHGACMETVVRITHVNPWRLLYFD